MALKTETDTPEMHDRIVEAFEAWIIGREPGEERAAPSFDVFFEHGQWWVRADFGGDDTCYSVVDAAGGDSVDGFSFEEV